MFQLIHTIHKLNQNRQLSRKLDRKIRLPYYKNGLTIYIGYYTYDVIACFKIHFRMKYSLLQKGNGLEILN